MGGIIYLLRVPAGHPSGVRDMFHTFRSLQVERKGSAEGSEPLKKSKGDLRQLGG